MSLNQVILLGRLGARPELQTTPSGKRLCRLRVATDVFVDGERRDPDWHRVVTWGASAENCAKYLDKGREVAVEGRLTTRKWTDPNGQDRYFTDVVAHRVHFVGAPHRDRPETESGAGPSSRSRSGNRAAGDGGPGTPPPPPPPDFGDDSDPLLDDDLPF